MIKKITTLALAITLLIGNFVPVFALEEEQEQAIQHFIDEARRISRAPGISVAVVAGGETHFFSSGLANRETETAANEDTLWSLASVTKAFTSLGILYLEEQGLLSMNDSVADYLPWLTFRYNGQPVDMQEMRLYHFMYHTSGLTMITNSDAGSVQDGIKEVIDAELTFYPGESFAYANENTNILGLIIETVSGQSYESFMEEYIFHPLGMMDTFANRDHAIATGRLAQGYATQFIFHTTQSERPDAVMKTNLPTGFLISSARDMARWTEIQLGLADDIPEIFQTIIPRSHESGQSLAEPDGSYYGAGWIISEDQSFIRHSGNHDGAGANVSFFPEEQLGIVLLTNLSGAHISAGSGLGEGIFIFNIRDILNGNLNQSYSMMWTFQMLDVTFTTTMVLCLLLAVLFTSLGLRRRKKNEQHPLTKKRIALILFWSIMALAMGIPMMLGSWLIPMIYSFLTMGIALALLFGSIAWFSAFPRDKK